MTNKRLIGLSTRADLDKMKSYLFLLVSNDPSFIRVEPLLKFEDESPMPLIKAGSSMMPDMKFGWKPEVKCSHPPIPLYFDFV